MANLVRTIVTVIDAQPFYQDEIRVIRMTIEAYRHRLPMLDRLRRH